LRYRVALPVPGARRRTIDVAFTRVKVAVFVDGCYWHGCVQHHKVPESNREWWTEKIRRNRLRDEQTTEHLEQLGWRVLRFWEHDVRYATDVVVKAMTCPPRPQVTLGAPAVNSWSSRS
jgi:DNA mismatch endonuclease (patch repair protein)